MYASVPFVIAIWREWLALGTTAESARAALLLPHDDPSRIQMAFQIDKKQRFAIRAIRLSCLALAVIFYYLAPR